MTAPRRRAYRRRMSRIVWAALLLSAAAGTRANAARSDIVVGAAPIVRINVRSGRILVLTGPRGLVHVDGPEGNAVSQHSVRMSSGSHPLLIPSVETKVGETQLGLPSENFVISIPPLARDVVEIKSATVHAGPTTVTVPADAAFVFVRSRGGSIDVRDYRGSLVTFAGRGTITLANVGGTVFAQTIRGAIDASDANVERLRARSLLGNLIFERCAVTQIEATSIRGSIVFDAGTFAPGLARFESESGDVAVGSNAGANFDGRAGSGRVLTQFAPHTAVRSRLGAVTAAPAGGGPLVSATSGTGNVFLYDGTLRDGRRYPTDWSEPIRTLANPMARERPVPVAGPQAVRDASRGTPRARPAARPAEPTTGTFGRAPRRV